MSVNKILCYVLLLLSHSSYHISAQNLNNLYGAEASNSTGSPPGGLGGNLRSSGIYHYLVRNKADLLNVLKTVRAGEAIYIADSANINLSGESPLIIPEGVTLGSGRGVNGSSGALLFSTDLGCQLISAGGENVHITGLRICGPDTARRTTQMRDLYKRGGHELYYSIPNSRGIISSFSRTTVSYCEIWGWSHAAISLTRPKNESGGYGNHVHHSYIHHNQREGLGYGISLDDTECLIEANIFDWNRHSIAGTGAIRTSYEARFNIVRSEGASGGYAFDMHGGMARNDGTDIAGSYMIIHHNTFEQKGLSIGITGRPARQCVVFNNWFYSTSESVKQYESFLLAWPPAVGKASVLHGTGHRTGPLNLSMINNRYGKDGKSIK